MIGIAAEHETVERAERVLRAWAAVVPGEPSEGLTVQRQKSKRLADCYGSSGPRVFGTVRRVCRSRETVSGTTKTARVSGDRRRLD